MVSIRVIRGGKKITHSTHIREINRFMVTTQVVIERQCTARCLQRVAPRKWNPNIRSFIEYKPLKSSEPHVESNVRYIAFQ